jgi:hypothetical protein
MARDARWSHYNATGAPSGNRIFQEDLLIGQQDLGGAAGKG